ncbi:aminodeoxychorismate lyase [Streptomyces sp. 150FB]|uniref:endolytic transglycosylase MltG n=1 Tax=Streptomyces sp. 150FB TaxID=1576605 RepID=UPI0005890D81|nr:endolytic transglycosylase MltG [Streptomyces sp. 150FB]KIF73289.1 aminodeoxychorismate lyase [Streptomyces sp. 150FB]
MTNVPPRPRRGRGSRLTRRGRLVLLAGVFLVLAAAVLVSVRLLTGGHPAEEPASLVVPEGRRASQVYASVDEALALPAGTTRRTAATARLALPPAARGNPEGYLFPATYPIGSATTPGSLLRYMVDTANRHFKAGGGSTRRVGAELYRTVTIASIVQAEADTASDMGKVARVILNRLDRGMRLQMDSTLNYALNRSTLDTTEEDTRVDNPFNTYQHGGLPPGPIGNPGDMAMRAAASPTAGGWLYFVTVGPGDTRFATTYAEQARNVSEFNAKRGNPSGNG